MNEIKIQNGSPGIAVICVAVLLLAIVCAGIIYYYRGADGQLESELDKLERNNRELASETRQLQADIAVHGTGIKTVRTEVSKSRERIEHVYIEIGESAEDADRAISIINDCEKIIEKVKTQR